MRRDPEAESWWLELEHERFGTVRVHCRWERVGRGIYAAIATAVEWDLFTPHEEQEMLTALLRASNLRAVAPMEH